ncbi:hypothetical protein RP20_CCG017461 [Aedes albopictus]|nr:hypothetical protein RP20_CCG017461 [Aedes albopictus]
MKLVVQPNEDCSPQDGIVIGFSLQYTYVNTVVEKSSTPAKKHQKQALATTLVVKLSDAVLTTA